MDRRSFLGTVTAATVVGRRMAWAAATHKIDKIGLQLYTVRGEMEKDVPNTLSKVAAAGYKEVELAGFSLDTGKVTYFKLTPQDLSTALKNHGLTAPSTHVSYKALEPDNFAKVLEASKTLGHEYIVNPWIEEDARKGPDGWKRAAQTLNKAGEMSKKAGFQFAYHNHWFEYVPENGKMPYDILLEETDPKLVKMELDLCWITVGRQDPLKYFDRYPGRFPLVHVKDLTKLPPAPTSGGQNYGDKLEEMTEVGSGMIDWKKIFAQSQKAGIKHYFVEHDNPKSPFDSIEASSKYLAQLRF